MWLCVVALYLALSVCMWLCLDLFCGSGFRSLALRLCSVDLCRAAALWLSNCGSADQCTWLLASKTELADIGKWEVGSGKWEVRLSVQTWDWLSGYRRSAPPVHI